jgi:hypothetical protein
LVVLFVRSSANGLLRHVTGLLQCESRRNVTCRKSLRYTYLKIWNEVSLEAKNFSLHHPPREDKLGNALR